MGGLRILRNALEGRTIADQREFDKFETAIEILSNLDEKTTVRGRYLPGCELRARNILSVTMPGSRILPIGPHVGIKTHYSRGDLFGVKVYGDMGCYDTLGFWISGSSEDMTGFVGSEFDWGQLDSGRYQRFEGKKNSRGYLDLRQEEDMSSVGRISKEIRISWEN